MVASIMVHSLTAGGPLLDAEGFDRCVERVDVLAW
jgi:hypothetical protein